jgi:hypothetical protein
MGMNKLIQTLYENRKLSTVEEVNAFNSTLREIMDKPQSPSSLIDLLSVFDNEAVELVTMWGLIHHLEDYDYEHYIEALIDFGVTEEAAGADEWLRILLVRVLNNGESREYLKQMFLKSDDKRRTFLRQTLQQIVNNPTGNLDLDNAIKNRVHEVLHSAK